MYRSKIIRIRLLLLLIIIFSLNTSVVYATHGDISSSKRFGGIGTDLGYVPSVDSQDRIIITGNVNGDADLNGDGDRTDGGSESSTGYGGNDIFISVFNSDDSYVWSKRLGGTGADVGQKVSVDTQDRIIITGNVTGNADLNGDGDSTDGGSESATGYGGTDTIISVFNSDGTYVWSKRLGSTGGDQGIGIITDTQNRIIITGSVTGNADLNGDGDSTDGGSESATGYGGTDIIISAFSSDGTYVWSKRLGGTGGDVGRSVSTDTQNRIIITGSVTGNVDMNGDGDSTDGGSESSVGYGSIDNYISVFSSDGTYVWSKRLGGTSVDQGTGVITDSQDRIILEGTTLGDSDLNGDGDSTDGGSESGTGYGSLDISVSVFNSDGTYIWSKRLGLLGNDQGNIVTVDNQDRIVITGFVTGDTDMNGDGDSTDSGGESGTGYGGTDPFVSVFTSAGDYVLSKRLGGIGSDGGQGLITDSQNRIIVTGYVTGDADLNSDGDSTDGGSESATGYGGFDAFMFIFDEENIVAAVDPCPSGCPNNPSNEEIFQILESSGGNAFSGPLFPTKDSDTGFQNVVAIIEPKTFPFNAFLSSIRQVEKPLESIPTSSGFAWQVGNIQQIWYKAYPPRGSDKSAINIVPSLQNKPSIISLSYQDSDLIPAGDRSHPFHQKSLKLAYSEDGKTWTILSSSVVDIANHTVAAIHKLGGYYMIVSEQQQSGIQTIQSESIEPIVTLVPTQIPKTVVTPKSKTCLLWWCW